MKRASHQSGMALLMVLVALALLSVLAVELLYSARVDSRISRNLKERLQAQYLAQSAAKLAILRMHLYKEARNAMVSNTQAQSMIAANTLNQIWSTPLPQMPFDSAPLPAWPGTISSNVETEGSKIPINLIDGNVDRESDSTTSQKIIDDIKSLIKNKIEEEGEFGDRYRDLNVDELVGNLKDWIDSDNERTTGGGEETADYERLDYRPRNNRLPTLSEIHMIKGWNEELYEVIAKPHFSILATSSGIDPNFISRDRLKSYHPALSDEDLTAVERRRVEQPFTSLDELAEFIIRSGEVKNGNGFSFGNPAPDAKKVEDVFYINAAGKVGSTQRSYRIGLRFTYVRPEAPAPGTPPPLTNHMDEAKKDKTKFDKLYIVSIEELI